MESPKIRHVQKIASSETLVRRFADVVGTEEHKVLVGHELPPFEPVREDD